MPGRENRAVHADTSPLPVENAAVRCVNYGILWLQSILLGGSRIDDEDDDEDDGRAKTSPPSS